MSSLITLLLAQGALAAPADPQIVYNAPVPDDAEYMEGEVIIGTRDPDLPDEVQIAGLRLLRDDDITGLDAAVYLLPAGADVVDVVRALRRSGRFLYAEPNYVVEALGAPTDPYYSQQWSIGLIDVEDAWWYSSGSKASVAVIDTGVTTGSSDGLNTFWGGYDYIDRDWNPADANGHGSFVASIVGNSASNGKGIAGVAFSTQIRAYRALDASGYGSVADVSSAMGQAVYDGARVLNLSLGGSAYSSTLAAAAASAYGSGAFIAAASGNDSASTLDFPAGLPYVVAVGAVDYNADLTGYSSYGSTSYGGVQDLVAPGGDTSADEDGDGYADGILGESNLYGGYARGQGTSFAAPHVSAAASILMSMGATNEEAELCLEATALDLGGLGWDSTYGNGLVQVEDALQCFLAWDILWTGSGTLGYWTTGSSDQQVASDLDGDGLEEMFSYNGTTWMGQEWNGTGWNKLVSGTASFAYAPVFGDFDGDGKEELLYRSATVFSLYKLSGSALVRFSATTPGSWRGATTDKIVVGDFDGDGRDEVFVASASAAQLLDYSSTSGKWSTTKSWSSKIGSASSWTLSSADRLVAGDFDGDGYCELFVANKSAATLLDDARSWTKLWPSSSSASTSLSALWTVSSSDLFSAGDFDGDGTDSLMVTNNVSSMMLDYSSASWSQVWEQTTGLLFWWSLNSTDRWLVYDADGDGRDDLEAFSGTGSHLMTWLY